MLIWQSWDIGQIETHLFLSPKCLRPGDLTSGLEMFQIQALFIYLFIDINFQIFQPNRAG